IRTFPPLTFSARCRRSSGMGSGQQVGSSASTRPLPSSSMQFPHISWVAESGGCSVGSVVVVGSGSVEVVVLDVEVLGGVGVVVDVVLTLVVEVVWCGGSSVVVVLVELVVVVDVDVVVLELVVLDTVVEVVV